MNSLAGIGKLDRARLAEMIRGTEGCISVAEASAILRVSPSEAAKMLSRWAKKGWLNRIKRGVYIPVPLESRTADVSLEEPWVIATKLYSPCYVGGLSAAEYWGLTEQIFRTVTIMTAQKPRNREPAIRGTKFLLRTVPQRAMFGLKTVWKGRTKILVSDQARTLTDLLSDPGLGGGIRPTADLLVNYLGSDNPDMNLVLDYAKRTGNGAVLKRLGFLLEIYAPGQKDIIDACRSLLSKGNVKLDPQLEPDSLVTRWRLWVPKSWQKTREKKS